MENLNYEERILKVAESMAKAEYPALSWAVYSEDTKEYYMKYARIAVALMAEAYEAGVKHGKEHPWMDVDLISLGLKCSK